MSSPEPQFKLFAMFIGRSGSGKSAAAASMPKPFEELDFDLRANGIRNCIDQGWLNPEGISFKQFDPFGGYLQIEQYLNLKYTLFKSRQFNQASIDVGSLYSMLRLLELTSLNNPVGANQLNISGLSMTGPADYKFESQAACKIMDFLRVLPCHITVAGHIVERYGKPPGADKYAPSIPIGEKLTITANLGESILAMFNDVYRFEKVIAGAEEKFYVEFSTDVAKNSFGIPPGKFDITRKEFWPYFVELVRSLKEGTFKKEQIKNAGLII